MTQWADDIDIDKPWNLYPRPYLLRDNWINLNGVWDFALTQADSERPDSLSRQILVPYPIESAWIMDIMLHKRFCWSTQADV